MQVVPAGEPLIRSKGVLSMPKSGRSRRVQMTSRLAAALREQRHLRAGRVLWRDPENRWDSLT